MRVHIVIPGPPVAKGRARVLKSGRSYTPAKTANYAAKVAHLGKQAMGIDGPYNGALSVFIGVNKEIPASWSKRKRADALAGIIKPVSRPDGDNYEKAILDGLNGVVWHDDGQVVDMTWRKRYAAQPCVVVSVEPA